MKISRIERAALIITVLAFLCMSSYFLAVNLSARPVTVITEHRGDPLSSQTAAPNTLDPSSPPFPININKASVAELILLPGIGEVRATAIVAHREKHGQFLYPAQLGDVEGIGEKTLAGVLDYITTN